LSRECLEKKFDHAQLLDSPGDMNFEESVKTFLHEIRFFTRGIYLSPSILVRSLLIGCITEYTFIHEMSFLCLCVGAEKCGLPI